MWTESSLSRVSLWQAPAGSRPQARVISGSLALWQTVKPLMLEVRGGRMKVTFGPVGKLQGLIRTHQDTPIWSEFWRRKKQRTENDHHIT